MRFYEFQTGQVLLDGKDIIVIARASAKGIGFNEIDGAVLHLCKLHGLIK